MGRSIKPKYVVVVDGNQSMIWNGRATAAALEKWVVALGQSMNPGGSNSHLRGAGNTIPYPRSAYIRHNHPCGAEVASWKSPAFMIW
jgi:hypothetical protein